MSVKVKIIGVDSALRTLTGYSAEVLAKCKDAVQTHTEAIASQARNDAPVDTGRLKSEITTDYSSGGLFGRARAKTPYAHIVENGSVTREARPFLHPAYESEKNKFVADIKTIVTE